MFSCKPNLHFLNSIDVLFVDRTFKFPPPIYNSWTQQWSLCATCIFLTGQLTSNVMRDCLFSDIHTYSNRCCKTWCDCLSNSFYADFETAIPSAVRTMWPGCEFKTCRFHLGQKWWSKMESLGLSKQYIYKKKERLLGKSVLEENIWTVAFTTRVSQRLLCLQSSERQASEPVLRLNSRKLY